MLGGSVHSSDRDAFFSASGVISSISWATRRFGFVNRRNRFPINTIPRLGSNPVATSPGCGAATVPQELLSFSRKTRDRKFNVSGDARAVAPSFAGTSSRVHRPSTGQWNLLLSAVTVETKTIGATSSGARQTPIFFRTEAGLLITAGTRAGPVPIIASVNRFVRRRRAWEFVFVPSLRRFVRRRTEITFDYKRAFIIRAHRRCEHASKDALATPRRRPS